MRRPIDEQRPLHFQTSPRWHLANHKLSNDLTTMRMTKRLLMVVFTLTSILFLTASQGGLAQQREFYSGKTITVVVGYSAGGGYDLYSRALARHLGRYIPGSPTVLVQNMPGAASLTAVRYLAATAPKDGTAITMFDPGLILESLASPDKLNVKFSDYQWIGSMSREVPICYSSRASGIKTWDDMMKRKEFIIGLTARGSHSYVNGATLRKVFNAPVRQVAGYPGSNEQRLAVERGELEGNCASWSAIPQDWIINSKINALVRFSSRRPNDMPANTPYANDLATTSEQKALLDVLNAPAELGRPFIVANQVPRERVQILRTAFAAALKDQGFLAEALKQSLPIELVSGDEAEGIVSTMYSAPPQLILRVKDVID
jgi:tripartite-type tricarboxylate transporter receptor subunit TctC